MRPAIFRDLDLDALDVLMIDRDEAVDLRFHRVSRSSSALLSASAGGGARKNDRRVVVGRDLDGVFCAAAVLARSRERCAGWIHVLASPVVRKETEYCPDPRGQ